MDVLDEVKPQVVVTYAEDGGYGHPDHIRAHEITRAAVQRVQGVDRLFYAVPSRDALASGLADLARSEDLPFDLPEPHELASVADESITTVIDIAEHLPAKISALRAHGTQVKVWVEQWRNGDGVASYALSNGVAHPVVATEHYVLATGPSEGCDVDLFGGLGVSGTEPVGDR